MSLLPDPTRPLPDEPGWPEGIPDDLPVVVLVDAATTLERRLLKAWAERHRPPGIAVETLDIAPSRRHNGRTTDPRLGARFSRPDDAWVFPVRIVWRPHERRGRRTASWLDVLKLGDPRDPDPIRQQVVLARWPERVSIAVGKGAAAHGILADQAAAVEVQGLAEFVTRRAHRSLDRAERVLRGDRYKVPKFLHEEILSRGEFQDGAVRIGHLQAMPADVAVGRARRYLHEIAANHSPFLIDLIANAIHWVYRQGYGAIIYDPERVRDIARLGADNPIAFLPSHRSNLDRLSLQYLLWENDLPPNHTAAGLNMNFFPVGPLIRGTGAFFIRRSFKDNELYKFVLRSYLDYLIENRFPLEWYMEGGRSRSGKLIPPRFGLLGSVVDSVRRGKADDLYLVPTSIAYDQIQDVADYATEASGGQKDKETFRWALKAIRSLRRRYGNIHVRFADPISVSKELDPDAGPEEVSLRLQKLAFEVMYRIGRVTPFTPTSVVAIALLSGRGAGQTTAQLAVRAAELDAYITSHGLPTTEELRLEDPVEVRAVLFALGDHGSVSSYDRGATPVFFLTPEQALQAAYYRNTVVHYFVPGAIAELALLVGEPGEEAFWDEVWRLRDLLKFEFFFSEREQFRSEVGVELAAADPGWESALGDPAARARLLEGLRPLRAHWSLLPFLEAYQIVADQLVDTIGEPEEKRFLASCLGRGRQYRIQGTVGADESVSQVLFRSALSLAANRGLETAGADAARRAFAAELADVRGRALKVAEVAERRLAEEVAATQAAAGAPDLDGV